MPEEQKQQETKTEPQTKAQQEEWRNADEVKQIIKQRDEFKAKAREQEARLAALENAQKERETREEQLKTQAEQERLKNEGKYREALELSEKKWKGSLEGFQGKVAKTLVPLAIQSAAGKLNNLTPEAISDLPSLLERHLQIDPETLEVYPVGQDGKRMVDERLQPVSVEQFVSGFVGTRPYLLKDSLPASHGAAGGASKRVEKLDIAALMADPKALRQMERDDPEGYAAAVAEWNNPKNHAAIAKAAVARKAAERATK